MPRWRKVKSLAKKEIRDILRDRRTIFMAIIFPIILYPLLIIGLVQATAVQASKAVHEKPLVAISGGEFAPDLREEFLSDKGLTLAQFDGSVPSLRQSGASAGVVISQDISETLAAGATATIKVYYDSANDTSRGAYEKVASVIEKYNRALLDRRLESADIDMAYVTPVQIDNADLATPRQRGVFRLGKMLAFLLVVFCMMGALYPALDAISGEKERGTLETLLSIPATRLEILAGKYVAVFSMSIASVLANFVSLSLTMVMVNRLLVQASAAGRSIDFSIPFSATVLLVPALVPLAAFFSAISLGIAAFARSTREGQYYLGPLYAAVLPLTAAAVVPGLSLTYVTALVPVMSISLFLKDGLLGTLRPGPTFLALAAQCFYAYAALKWAAKVFSREDVLFSSPLGEEQLPRPAIGLVRPAHVMTAWAVSVILFFYGGVFLQAKLGALSVTTALLSNVVFLLLPIAVVFLVTRFDVRKVLPLKALAGGQISAVLLFIPAAFLLNIVFNAVQHFVLAPPVPVMQMITAGKEKVSIEALFISVALMPAICEELFYRGLVFRSFAARMPLRYAVIFSSALFAAAHFNVYEILPLFALGVVLALTMQATGTLIAAMIVHFANNALTIVVALLFPTLDIPWFFLPVFAILGFACLLLAYKSGVSDRKKTT